MDVLQSAGARQKQTTIAAVIAATPGLALTAVAAFNANALTLYADLVLTGFDMVVLLAALVVAARPNLAGDSRTSRQERGICALVALCMVLSMSVVGWAAWVRIADGASEPSGGGIILGLMVNGVYAALNLWILLRWRRECRHKSSAFARSQLFLFYDKLSTNILISMSLAVTVFFDDAALVRYADPVASLLIVAATVRWTVPVLQEAFRGICTNAAA